MGYDTCYSTRCQSTAIDNVLVHDYRNTASPYFVKSYCTWKVARISRLRPYWMMFALRMAYDHWCTCCHIYLGLEQLPNARVSESSACFFSWGVYSNNGGSLRSLLRLIIFLVRWLMEFTNLVNVNPIFTIVVCGEDSVNLVLECQYLVDGLHCIAPVACGHRHRSWDARNLRPQRVSGNMHDSIAHHDWPAGDVNVRSWA